MLKLFRAYQSNLKVLIDIGSSLFLVEKSARYRAQNPQKVSIISRNFCRKIAIDKYIRLPPN